METVVEEKVNYLESVLSQFIVSTNTSLDRLERNVSALTREMSDFKDEMRDFKDEMRDFKDESRAERRAMNKKWGELANKMGTVVEDIVAPSLGGIAREYFNVDQFDFFAVRVRKRKNGGTIMREFDVVAENKDYFFLVETKSTARTEYIRKFIEFIPDIPSWFPEAKEKKIIPVFASLFLPDDSIAYLTNNNVFAMAMKDDNMDKFNNIRQRLMTKREKRKEKKKFYKD